MPIIRERFKPTPVKVFILPGQPSEREPWYDATCDTLSNVVTVQCVVYRRQPWPRSMPGIRSTRPARTRLGWWMFITRIPLSMALRSQNAV